MSVHLKKAVEGISHNIVVIRKATLNEINNSNKSWNDTKTSQNNGLYTTSL